MEDLAILEDRLGYKFKNRKFLELALTHSSYANEHNLESNERLEFLGDAVLELVVSEYLYKNTEYPEGEMTKLRSSYVCENANCEYSMELGLNEYLFLGHGEEENGGRTRKAIVADVFESFIGAVFLDQGLETARKIIYKIVIPKIEDKKSNLFKFLTNIQDEVYTFENVRIHLTTQIDGGQ